MTTVYGVRDIIRNSSLLRIKPNDSFIVEDKKSHKTLGVYLGGISKNRHAKLDLASVVS